MLNNKEFPRLYKSPRVVDVTISIGWRKQEEILYLLKLQSTRRPIGLKQNIKLNLTRILQKYLYFALDMVVFLMNITIYSRLKME